MKKQVFWIVELFVWVLILSAISGLIMLAKYNHKKYINTYQIFLPDVDGLIKGSPVKFLGIQVGYVSQLDIVDEDVYVKFIINEKNVKLPPGSIATVEFSGLGGSKSLELYPPHTRSVPSDRLLVIEPPKRIHDSFSLLNKMYDQIVDITYSVSHFMDRIGIIKIKEEITTETKKQNSINDFLNSTDKVFEKTQGKLDKFENKIKKNGVLENGYAKSKSD